MIHLVEFAHTTAHTLTSLPLIDTAQHIVSNIHTDDTNPIDTIKPSFDFGTAFNARWKKVFAAVWGGLIIITILALGVAISKLGHSNDQGNVHGVQQSRKHVTWAAAALGGEAMLSVIAGAVLYITS